MKKKKLQLGAEQSGNIIIARDCLIGDGIFSAITILNILKEVGDLKQYVSEVKKYYQVSKSIEVVEEMKDYILSNCEFKTFLENCENELGIKGRLVLRKSGTENLIRILVEGDDLQQINFISETIKEKILEISK